MVEFVRVADWEKEGYESAVSLERSSSDGFDRKVWWERLGSHWRWLLRCVWVKWELKAIYMGLYRIPC